MYKIIAIGLITLTAACSHFGPYVSPMPMYGTDVTTYNSPYVAPSTEDIATFKELKDLFRPGLFTPEGAEYLDENGHGFCMGAALWAQERMGGEIWVYQPVMGVGQKIKAFHAVVVKNGVEWNVNYNGPARFKTSDYHLCRKLDIKAMKADADSAIKSL